MKILYVIPPPFKNSENSVMTQALIYLSFPDASQISAMVGVKFVSSGTSAIGDGFRSLPIPQIAGLQSPHHASFNFWRTFHFRPNSSGESERKLWRLSDISGTAGKKWKPRLTGIFPTYENQA